MTLMMVATSALTAFLFHLPFSVLCKRDVAEIDWEKHVTVGRESKVKRMLEFELYEAASEEVTSGKRIWNSAWRSQEWRDQHYEKTKSVVHESAMMCLQVSSRLCEKTRLFGNS